MTSKGIAFIINRMGKLVAGLESLEDNEDSSRFFLEFALKRF
jgi:hypothetical protein